MKKLVVLFCVMCVVLISSVSFALDIYVDAAPNQFGSPDYEAWKDAGFSNAVDGTYVNMANSFNPDNVGTTNFEIQDEVVYSFGDLGKRLTWTYWIPNETVENLDGRFKISLFNYWDNGPAWDFYDYYYGSTWQQPGSWLDYNGGVIGTAGMAYWGANGTNTESDLAADIASWGSVDESWVFTAKLDGVEYSLTSNRDAVAPVPEPSTWVLLGTGLAGLAYYRRKKC